MNEHRRMGDIDHGAEISTLYRIHEREIARGYEPYPYAHLLDGAPMFRFTGWLDAQCKRLAEWMGL
jgi:hypothetical protein